MSASTHANPPKAPVVSLQVPPACQPNQQAVRTPRILTCAVMTAALLSTGCSNFDSRKHYWNEQLAGKLKAAPLYRLKSFAAANGHELTCNGDGVSREGAPDLSECDLVDSRSKGALFNYRGKLFVTIRMVDGKVESHSFTTSTVLY